MKWRVGRSTTKTRFILFCDISYASVYLKKFFLIIKTQRFQIQEQKREVTMRNKVQTWLLFCVPVIKEIVVQELWNTSK